MISSVIPNWNGSMNYSSRKYMDEFMKILNFCNNSYIDETFKNWLDCNNSMWLMDCSIDLSPKRHVIPFQFTIED